MVKLRRLKKSVLACYLAVSLAFMTALGLCISVLYSPQAVGALDGGLKIVIDAGHGGIDGGVTGVQTGVKESDLNLTLSFALKDELEKIALNSDKIKELTDGKQIVKVIVVPGKLVNIVIK